MTPSYQGGCSKKGGCFNFFNKLFVVWEKNSKFAAEVHFFLFIYQKLKNS